jgi:hypothetical protein
MWRALRFRRGRCGFERPCGNVRPRHSDVRRGHGRVANVGPPIFVRQQRQQTRYLGTERRGISGTHPAGLVWQLAKHSRLRGIGLAAVNSRGRENIVLGVYAGAAVKRAELKANAVRRDSDEPHRAAARRTIRDRKIEFIIWHGDDRLFVPNPPCGSYCESRAVATVISTAGAADERNAFKMRVGL